MRFLQCVLLEIFDNRIWSIYIKWRKFLLNYWIQQASKRTLFRFIHYVNFQNVSRYTPYYLWDCVTKYLGHNTREPSLLHTKRYLWWGLETVACLRQIFAFSLHFRRESVVHRFEMASEQSQTSKSFLWEQEILLSYFT